MTAESDDMTDIVLDIDKLTVGLGKGAQSTRIIDGISLRVREGETLCLVGESGSGKSVTSLTVMGLLQKGALAPTGGSIKLVGEELLGASDRRLRQLRATTMAMIFQEPMTALNPVVPVGRQIDEVLRVQTDFDARARRKRILAMMEQVRLPEVERIFASYPHRLSGGQRQRIMIAMALVLEPKLLIADEPTTALDVTTQKQILTLIRELQHDHGTAVLFITHDMGVVAEIADRVAVMRHGQLVETGTLDGILRAPTMEYTRNLLAAVPSLVPRAPRAESTEPVVLEANELGKVYRERTFFGGAREVAAAQNVTLTLRKGRTLGIVGESGSGKSTVARCIVRLIDPTSLSARPSPKARSISACRMPTRWRRRANCSNWLICRSTPSRAIPINSPEDNASVSPLPARWRSIRTCWWRMKRSRRWTSRCRRRSWNCSTKSRPGSALRCYSSPTICASRRKSVTMWRSCSTAVSSNRVRRHESSQIRKLPIRERCLTPPPDGSGIFPTFGRLP
jgi:ABC-type glutathione transport system ATPase component